MTQPDEYPYGPGTGWLAKRAGVRPEELVTDPGMLLRALAAAVRDAPELAADRDQLVTLLSAGDRAGEMFGRRVAAALRAETERLRAEPSYAQGDPVTHCGGRDN